MESPDQARDDSLAAALSPDKQNCLFAAFISWCEVREERKISCNLFFRQIQQLKEQEYRPELDGARPTCWVLKVPAAKKRGIKRHLGDE